MEPVLILGAGINGCALARELAVNGVPVWVVESNDIASGATSRSSRLIHGGLRYLEHGEFDLVRESLVERARLLRLAPQFVRPLRLFIPAKRRLGGFLSSSLKFFGWKPPEFFGKARGDWLVRIGLTLYDRFAADDHLPRHQSHRVGDAAVPKFSPQVFPYATSYSDAQIRYPERFTLALLEDARLASQANGSELRIFTKAKSERRDGKYFIAQRDRSHFWEIKPSAVINATGAWGDETLKKLAIEKAPMFAGTKGSHFVTRSSALREALAGQSVYAEADDGRLVFVLSLDDAVLVGTTDERFLLDPSLAIATNAELNYLRTLVHQLFPQVALTESDIDHHYCGVRPLPQSNKATTAAVTRRHLVERSEADGVPLLTLIGGKLTTCRAFAELAADTLFPLIGVARRASTIDRLIPGAKDYPASSAELQSAQSSLVESFHWPIETVHALWSILGTRTTEVMKEMQAGDRSLLEGTHFPISFVRWVVQNEHARSIEDVVERRLMLLDHPVLTRRALRQISEILRELDLQRSVDAESEVEEAERNLITFFGKKVLAE